MVNLLDSLFTPEKADALRRLWVDDESSRPALNRELGRAIIAGGDTISVLPCSGETSVNVVMLICASAPFEFDDYEPVMVAGFIMESMRTPLYEVGGDVRFVLPSPKAWALSANFASGSTNCALANNS
jgi:hypothetical protein